MKGLTEECHDSDYSRFDMRFDQPWPEEVHDETLFTIAHQVHELWLEEFLHELKSVLKLFSSMPLEGRKIGLIDGRLARLVAVQKIINRQTEVLETISPLDFLDLPDRLFSGSVFESSRLCEVELRLGLATRVIPESFHRFQPEEREALQKACNEKTLLEAVDDWLANMPFRSIGGEFWLHYRRIVHDRLERDHQRVQKERQLSGWERQGQLAKLENARYRFDALFKSDEYESLRDEGLFQFRQGAVLSALFLLLYRDEVLLRLPFSVLKRLMDIDEQLITWRVHRSVLEQPLLGINVGPGSGLSRNYLREMIMEEKKIFRDLFTLATFLVPRSSLPPLPSKIQQSINAYFSRCSS